MSPAQELEQETWVNHGGTRLRRCRAPSIDRTRREPRARGGYPQEVVRTLCQVAPDAGRPPPEAGCIGPELGGSAGFFVFFGALKGI